MTIAIVRWIYSTTSVYTCFCLWVCSYTVRSGDVWCVCQSEALVHHDIDIKLGLLMIINETFLIGAICWKTSCCLKLMYLARLQFPLVKLFKHLGLYIKIKQSRYRPGVTQRVPGGLGSQISWHSAREGGEVISLTHRSPLPSRMFLVLIFTRSWVDPSAIERSEGLMSLKNPVTTPGIDPGSFRLVAQLLNHYATPGPLDCI
jgi:hypothetical protein